MHVDRSRSPAWLLLFLSDLTAELSLSRRGGGRAQLADSEERVREEREEREERALILLQPRQSLNLIIRLFVTVRL